MILVKKLKFFHLLCLQRIIETFFLLERSLILLLPLFCKKIKVEEILTF